MISEERRKMFSDLYRMAEFYENPPFKPGDIDGNADWFVMAQKAQLIPFLLKYPDDQLAAGLAMAVIDEANRQAGEMNKAGMVGEKSG